MEIKIDNVQRATIVNQQFGLIFGPTNALPNDALGLAFEMKKRLDKFYDTVFEAGYRQREGEEAIKSIIE